MNKHLGLEFNGYRWFSHYKGVHSFQKRSDDGHRWMLVQCSEDQLYNGDILIMTEHGWTLSKEMQHKVHRWYEKNIENE